MGMGMFVVVMYVRIGSRAAEQPADFVGREVGNHLLARLERVIRAIKNDRKEDLGDIYDRLNEQGRDLHEIIGMLKTLTPPNKK